MFLYEPARVPPRAVTITLKMYWRISKARAGGGGGCLALGGLKGENVGYVYRLT